MTDSVPRAKKAKLSAATATVAQQHLSANPNCRKKIWLAAALIIAVGVTAYFNSFQGGFLRPDDVLSITDNPHIQKLWPLSEAISLPLWSTGATVAGRPILSLSFAINYAFSALEPWGYHLVNLIIHISAALLLFGIIRRTLHTEQFHQHLGPRALPLALTVVLIWLVHPFQTESVTQIAQRAESMMAMFFLLTLYCAIRGFQSNRRGLWYLASVLACALGMGTKEVMAAAPLIVPLYDYVFVSKSLKTMLHQRWIFYVSLAATWTIVLALVIITHLKPAPSNLINKNWVVLKDADWLGFTQAQPAVVLEYLRLSLWPWPQGFQGLLTPPLLSATTFGVILSVVIVIALLALIFWGLLRYSWPAFTGAWFFLILAPSSSFIPTLDVSGCLHRMYLPLSAVVTTVIFGGDYFFRKLFTARLGQRAIKTLTLAVVLAIVAALTFMTWRQNKNYQSEVAMWTSVLRHNPDSTDAHTTLSKVFSEQGDTIRADFHSQELLRIYKDKYERAIQVNPNQKKAHYNLGIVFANQGNLERARVEFEYEIRINPNHVEAHYNLGNIFLTQGKLDKAAAEYERAISIKPEQFADYIIDHVNTQINARINLGKVLLGQGKLDQAIANYEKALETAPDNTMAMNNLAWLLATCPKDNLRNGPRAVELAERICDVTNYQTPTFLNTLAAAYAEAGRFTEAVETATKALTLTKSQNGSAAQIKQGQLYLERYKAGRPFRYRP